MLVLCRNSASARKVLEVVVGPVLGIVPVFVLLLLAGKLIVIQDNISLKSTSMSCDHISRNALQVFRITYRHILNLWSKILTMF